MSANQIVSGGERVGQSPVSSPALRVSLDRPRSVIRRWGHRLARFYRAVDWGYCGALLAVAVTVFVLMSVAFERSGW